MNFVANWYPTERLGTGDELRVWYRWNQDYTQTSGSVTVTGISSATTTYTDTCVTTWANWNVKYVNEYRQEVVSQEEIARREVIQKARAQAREAAKIRAEELLLITLTPEQREQYAKHGYFETEVNDRRFRIRGHSYSGNVEELRAGKIIASYCCHLTGDQPVADHLIAQKLMIESRLEEFLRLANRTAR